jgi:hypothetical protein
MFIEEVIVYKTYSEFKGFLRYQLLFQSYVPTSYNLEEECCSLVHVYSAVSQNVWHELRSYIPLLKCCWWVHFARMGALTGIVSVTLARKHARSLTLSWAVSSELLIAGNVLGIALWRASHWFVGHRIIWRCLG